MRSSLALFVSLGLSAFGAGSDSDRQIEEVAATSFNFRIALENHVKITVEDGNAVLTGKVALEEQRLLAVNTVASIPGVMRVEDQTAVKGEREGSDAWLALKLRSRMLAKCDVSLADTSVAVKNGVAILSGFAEDETQRALTEDYARDTPGITGVQNQMEIRRGDAIRTRVCELLDDCSIIAQIRYELSFYPAGTGQNAHFESQDGRVTISGTAQSGAERDLLTRVVRTIRGVDAIINVVTVTGR
jgi:osmotically-inducible protein OsmY